MDITLDGFLKVLGASTPVLLLVLTAVLKRRHDRAMADKTDAEAHLSRVTADKTRQETAGFVLDQAARLVDEFREYQAEKDIMAAEKIAASEGKLQVLSERVGRMEEYFSRLRAALATHGTWDAAALVQLREIHDDYPDPPGIPKDWSEDRENPRP